MSDDIVERARFIETKMNRPERIHYDGCDASHIECFIGTLADEIERLRAQVRKLRDALEPIAIRAELLDQAYRDRLWGDDAPVRVPMRSARRASRVLKETER